MPSIWSRSPLWPGLGTGIVPTPAMRALGIEDSSGTERTRSGGHGFLRIDGLYEIDEIPVGLAAAGDEEIVPCAGIDDQVAVQDDLVQFPAIFHIDQRVLVAMKHEDWHGELSSRAFARRDILGHRQ